MHKKAYALHDINVHGTVYKAGQELKCGQGAIDSMVRCGHASHEKPGRVKPQPKPPEGDNEPGDDDPDDNGAGDNETDEVETTPRGELPIAGNLALDEETVKLLEDAGVSTLGGLDAYAIDPGLQKINGVGKATEDKILEALQAFDEQHPPPDDE